MKNKKISIIGGAGHVGMPLGLKFAQKGYKVVAIDKNKSLNKLLNAGKVPYKEFDAKNLLKSALKNNKIYWNRAIIKIIRRIHPIVYFVFSVSVYPLDNKLFSMFWK